MLIQVQEASRIPNRLDQIIIKTTSTEKRRILKAAREKKQHTKVYPSKS
jgi:hypothetical protein